MYKVSLVQQLRLTMTTHLVITVSDSQQTATLKPTKK